MKVEQKGMNWSEHRESKQASKQASKAPEHEEVEQQKQVNYKI